MLGYLMEKEVKAVDNILSDIKRPFTAIMGGSKVSTKIGIIENLMDKVDNLILCGGMTYTFAKALGMSTGVLDTVNVALVSYTTTMPADKRRELERYLAARLQLAGIRLVDVGNISGK